LTLPGIDLHLLNHSAHSQSQLRYPHVRTAEILNVAVWYVSALSLQGKKVNLFGKSF
jgi:hypothetical protein